jgi:hypothetical protein
MVSMKKEMIASLSDLEAVIVQCASPLCKAEIKVPVHAALTHQDSRMVSLTSCPVCLTNFDSSLVDYVKSFVKSLSAHRGQEKISILLKTEGE